MNKRLNGREGGGGVFYMAKGHVLHCKRAPFTPQKGVF